MSHMIPSSLLKNQPSIISVGRQVVTIRQEERLKIEVDALLN